MRVLDCLAAGDEPSLPIHGCWTNNVDALLESLGPSAARWAAAQEFTGKRGEVLLVPQSDGAPTCALFGFGDECQKPELIAGHLATKLPAGQYRLEGKEWMPARDVLAFALASYRFEEYRGAKKGKVRLIVPQHVDGAQIDLVARGVHLARDLINRPANDLGPEELAQAVRELANAHNGNLKVTIGEDLLDHNFPLIHAVGAASVRLPRLIDLAWGDPQHPKITLVGKGVCFDTGGLNLKPGGSMALMKKDMGGAANVIALAGMIMEANLPVRLRLLVPAVENSVSGAAFRPGDVFTSRSGLTVEIGNTDAEGRLVLADALALAVEEKPDLLIDLATLTGAARVALGPDVPPYYTDDDELAGAIARHGREQWDPLWRLPLWDAYDDLLKSPIADVNHISSGGFAGSITAALFLRRFVDRDISWAHFDIYGWSPKAKPSSPKGGEAQAIRALYALIKQRF